MQKRSLDTNEKAEKVQISLIQKASIAKRASLMRSISRTVIGLSRRAISRANPGADEKQLDVLFVSHHYGPELADLLRNYLKQRSHEI